MKLLLEFKDYSDLSFIKDTVEDVILSEIEESIKPVIHQSIITISDGEVTCYDLKRSEYGSSNLDFKSYLISLNDRIKEEDFNNISAKIESILSLEFDEKIKCTNLQFFPINEFIICNADEIEILNSICNFEYTIEDELYEIKDNEYSSVIDLTIDDFENTKGITIWIRKYNSNFGVNLRLEREKIESNYLNYKITTSFFFNSARDLPNRWIQEINLDKPEGFRQSDLNIKNWIERNLHPVDRDVFSKLKNIENKISEMDLKFKLDLDVDPNEEGVRLINMIREKVFPIFSNKETENISNLYKQFKKLEEYNIEADWQHQGNYFYLFDINYKQKHYIINLKYDVKENLVEIKLKDKNIIDKVPIEELSDTIYLILQEN
jgi:hypothetical protein